MTRKEKLKWILDNPEKAERICKEHNNRPIRDRCFDCPLMYKNWYEEELSWCDITNAQKYGY